MKVRDDQDETVGDYWYDGDGKRVKKHVPSTGEVTVFVYDAGGKLVAEYSTIVASTNDATVAYLTNDHLGSPRINTDANGSVTARHDYHPFGEEIYTSQRTQALGYTADTIRKQFTSYERDNETDLDFAQARMYSQQLGRFTSKDEFPGIKINPQSHNGYGYVLNNPLKFNDPSGLTWQIPSKTEVTEAKTEWNDQMDYLMFYAKRKDKPFDPRTDKPVKDKNGSETPILVRDPVTGRIIFHKKAGKAYNCHAFAWYTKKGDPKEGLTIVDGTGTSLFIRGWDNDVSNNIDGYEQLDFNVANKKGDRVIYYVDENGNGRYDDGEEALHSAKVTKVDKEGNTTEVESKRGQLGVSKNHPNAPGFYDKASGGTNDGKPTSRAYFRKRRR